jgi:hypothetical protein
MLTRLVPDQAGLKIASRYANAVHTLLKVLGTEGLPVDLETMDFPKGPSRRDFQAARRVWSETRKAAAEAKIELPEVSDCRAINSCVKALHKRFKKEVPVPDDAAKVANRTEYRGFVVQVYELKDIQSPRKFMPVILLDDEVVRRIFVRSKTAYISLNHFAMRAIDEFLTYGRWPEKQGVSLSR